MVMLDAKIPEGPIEDKWDNHKFNVKLVNPANKRKFEVIVVGTGLAGASAAASLATAAGRGSREVSGSAGGRKPRSTVTP